MHRSRKLVQWAERLATFNYDVQHVRGLDNAVADALSRLPLPSSENALLEVSRDIMLKRITGAGLTLTELQSSTAGDETLHQILGFVCSQWPPKKQVPSDLSPYYHIQDELHIEEGCLVRDCQFVPPSDLRKWILGLAHSGHPGVTRMKQLL